MSSPTSRARGFGWSEAGGIFARAEFIRELARAIPAPGVENAFDLMCVKAGRTASI
jgi:hypothetical protein